MKCKIFHLEGSRFLIQNIDTGETSEILLHITEDKFNQVMKFTNQIVDIIIDENNKMIIEKSK